MEADTNWSFQKQHCMMWLPSPESSIRQGGVGRQVSDTDDTTSFIWSVLKPFPRLQFLFFPDPFLLLLLFNIHLTSCFCTLTFSSLFGLSPLSQPLPLPSKHCGDSSKTPQSSPPPEATPGRWWSPWVCAVCRSVWGYRPWTAVLAGSRWLHLHKRFHQRARSGRSPAHSGTNRTGQNSRRGQRLSADCAPWRSWCCPQSSVQEGSPACAGTGSEAGDFWDSQSLHHCPCWSINQTAGYMFPLRFGLFVVAGVQCAGRGKWLSCESTGHWQLAYF